MSDKIDEHLQILLLAIGNSSHYPPAADWRISFDELTRLARLGAAIQPTLDAHMEAIQNDDTGESGRALFDDLQTQALSANKITT